MGIFDAFSKQFIAVIDWTEDEDGVLSYRFPMVDREIQNGGGSSRSAKPSSLFSSTRARSPTSSVPACIRSRRATCPS